MQTNILGKATLTAKDVAAYFDISLAGAYNLMNSEAFPRIKIGRRVVVRQSSFNAWLEEQEEKERDKPKIPSSLGV